MQHAHTTSTTSISSYASNFDPFKTLTIPSPRCGSIPRWDVGARVSCKTGKGKNIKFGIFQPYTCKGSLLVKLKLILLKLILSRLLFCMCACIYTYLYIWGYQWYTYRPLKVYSARERERKKEWKKERMKEWKIEWLNEWRKERKKGILYIIHI